jgi:hypothetical protein
MTCDDYQIAIEREAHGALPEDERAALQGHLSSCEPCRAYRVAAQDVERAMATEATEAIREVDWARVERGIRDGIWRALQGVVAAVLGGCFMVALIWYTASPAFLAQRMLRVGLAMGAAVALVAVVMGAAAWRLQRLERGADMLEHYRQGVRAKVAFGRWMDLVMLVLAAAMAWQAATRVTDRFDAPVFYGVCAALLVGLAAWNRLVKLPQALREQADLERGGSG